LEPTHEMGFSQAVAAEADRVVEAVRPAQSGAQGTAGLGLADESSYDGLNSCESSYDGLNSCESSYDGLNSCESSYDGLNSCESSYGTRIGARRSASKTCSRLGAAVRRRAAWSCCSRRWCWSWSRGRVWRRFPAAKRRQSLAWGLRPRCSTHLLIAGGEMGALGNPGLFVRCQGLAPWSFTLVSRSNAAASPPSVSPRRPPKAACGATQGKAGNQWSLRV